MYSKIKILIAEDDHFSCILIKEYLKSLNADIKKVRNGQEAVKFCMESPPDLVLMDILMPGMCGIEAMKQIKKDNPEIKVLAQTAYGTHEKINEIINAGFDAIILKPYKKEDLLNLVKRELDKTTVV